MKKATAKKGKNVSPLHIEIFKDRVIMEGEIFNCVESTIVDSDNKPLPSSLPHLTHKSSDRAAHITSSRVVATSDTHVIHQRFHQNDDGLSEPTHDRYFAVEKATGIVYGATAKFNDKMHIGKKDVLPMRGGPLLSDDLALKIVFTVGEVDEKTPPMSPRSRDRKVPSTGYTS